MVLRRVEYMSNKAKFWDRVAKKYAADPVPDEEVYKKKLTITQTYFNDDSQVFEFGCGTGTTAIHHAPLVRRILATDISASMLEIARQKAEQENLSNIEFKNANIEDLDIEPSSFDVVLALSILHLLEDKNEVIEQVFSMLKPGGVFVSSTVCIADIVKFHKLLSWFGPLGRALGLLPFISIFTSDNLKSALVKAGFEIEKVWQPTGKSKAIFIVAKKPKETE